MLIVFAKCLEAGYAAYRLARAWFDMIDIVVVEYAEIRNTIVVARVECYRFWMNFVVSKSSSACCVRDNVLLSCIGSVS